MNSQELRALQEAYSQVYELDEKTAMTKRGLDEPAIRNQIAANTKGGESADRATALEKQTTYDRKKDEQRQDYARAQRGTYRKTNSSSPGLRGYAYQSKDPAVKELQSARGNQRAVVTLTPNERAISNRSSERTPSKPVGKPTKLPIPKGGGSTVQSASSGRSGGYTVGGSQGYGISNIKLADSYDLYDIILSHLIEEGYAESVEQAEAIMVNMSEDWRESIVEMNNLPSGGKTPTMKYGTGKPGGTMVYDTGKPTGKSVYKKGPDGRPSPYQPM